VQWQLDQGRAGVLVDIDDPRAMADAMVALGRDPARWQALSTAARARARQLFPLDLLVDQYCSLYRQVLLDTGAPHAAALAS
jgi:glycosyltransferase involved in cell wall biosynthesis